MLLPSRKQSQASRGLLTTRVGERSRGLCDDDLCGMAMLCMGIACFELYQEGYQWLLQGSREPIAINCSHNRRMFLRVDNFVYVCWAVASLLEVCSRFSKLPLRIRLRWSSAGRVLLERWLLIHGAKIRHPSCAIATIFSHSTLLCAILWQESFLTDFSNSLEYSTFFQNSFWDSCPLQWPWWKESWSLSRQDW